MLEGCAVREMAEPGPLPRMRKAGPKQTEISTSTLKTHLSEAAAEITDLRAEQKKRHGRPRKLSKGENPNENLFLGPKDSLRNALKTRTRLQQPKV
jgi:hypothetical protein